LSDQRQLMWEFPAFMPFMRLYEHYLTLSGGGSFSPSNTCSLHSKDAPRL
jgi:hypothetical protein